MRKYKKSVHIWLFTGLILLFLQVVIGGVTRLTESGLSIVEWEPISGAMIPTSEDAWQIEYDKYKDSPQYREINEGMSMADFKFIYFWEWFHRNWARFMGLVFAFPFIIFLARKYFDSPLIKRLIGVILLAGLAASFGWIMVKSGLDKRPWVNAYKLALHLCIAFVTFTYLLWTYLKTYDWRYVRIDKFPMLALKIFMILLWVQLFVGGVMSGMKAGIYYPTWPDLHGEMIPSILFDSSQWSYHNFNYYESSSFMPALIQVIHRSTAYILFGLGIWLGVRAFKLATMPLLRKCSIVFVAVLIWQVLVGIMTVISCKGEVPVSWGVLHQASALALLTASYVFYFFVLNSSRDKTIS